MNKKVIAWRLEFNADLCERTCETMALDRNREFWNGALFGYRYVADNIDNPKIEGYVRNEQSDGPIDYLTYDADENFVAGFHSALTRAVNLFDLYEEIIEEEN